MHKIGFLTFLIFIFDPALAQVTTPVGPDLVISRSRLKNSITMKWKCFPRGDCEAQESCVDGPGWRRLLRFSTKVENIGNGDLIIGDPKDPVGISNRHFEYHACHEHHHFKAFAEYQLMRSGSEEVIVRGRKASFCLLDTEQTQSLRFGRYTCGNQGISVGWADVYSRDLPCQYIDITGVSTGRYELKVKVNPLNAIRETNYANNEVNVSVEIPQSDPPRWPSCD